MRVTNECEKCCQLADRRMKARARAHHTNHILCWRPYRWVYTQATPKCSISYALRTETRITGGSSPSFLSNVSSAMHLLRQEWRGGSKSPTCVSRPPLQHSFRGEEGDWTPGESLGCGPCFPDGSKVMSATRQKVVKVRERNSLYKVGIGS